MSRFISFTSEATRASRRTHAFTRIELVAVLTGLLFLAGVIVPATARGNDDGERSVCLDNMKQIMSAVAMYSTDNRDILPHPSWGAGMTGPNNWCYATRLPSGQAAPNAMGRSGPEANTNQIPFYRAGQLASFLKSQRVLICPTDWRNSMSAQGSVLYRPREQKLSSYAMSGVVGNYVGKQSLLLPGSTFKASDFLPADILLWEVSERDPFYFNDAGENPEAIQPTQRHVTANREGLGGVGRAGGSADFLTWSEFRSLQSKRQLNDLFCGPGYR